MGEIRKRGAVWWIRYYRDGRRYEESAHTTVWKDARDLLNTKEGAIANGVPVSPRTSKYTFADAVTDITNDYTSNGRKSLAHLKRRIEKHLGPWFGRRRMADISTGDVLAFRAARLAAKASNAEINRELAILRRMFSLALLAEKLLRVPKVPMLKEHNVRKGFLDVEQFRAVRAKLPAALQPLATFAYVTGWRRSEILKLEWRQVDMDAGEIRLDVGATKNGQGRVIPFGVHPDLKAAFDTLHTEHEALKKQNLICPSVFTRNGKPIRDFRGAWQSACEAAGVPGRLLHDCRRSAARNLIRAGVTQVVAMKITGHLTRSIFDRYNIVEDNDLTTAMQKLSDRDNLQGQTGKKPLNSSRRSA